jgi:hypothetical protein
MTRISKSAAQLYVALGMILLWGFGLLLAQFDGDAMVKIMTPFMAGAIGWLFTEKAVS